MNRAQAASWPLDPPADHNRRKRQSCRQVQASVLFLRHRGVLHAYRPLQIATTTHGSSIPWALVAC